jgi:hypothetical protein
MLPALHDSTTRPWSTAALVALAAWLTAAASAGAQSVPPLPAEDQGRWVGRAQYMTPGDPTLWDVELTLTPTGGQVSYSTRNCAATLTLQQSIPASHLYTFQEKLTTAPSQRCAAGLVMLRKNGNQFTLFGTPAGIPGQGFLSKADTNAQTAPVSPPPASPFGAPGTAAGGPGQDCVIEQPPALGYPVIRGTCYTHTLASRLGPSQGCPFRDGPSIFTVTDCVVDGKFIAGRMGIAKPIANNAAGPGGQPLAWAAWPATPVSTGSMRVHDLVVGSGEEATGDRAAIVSFTSYQYNAGHPEFKGAARSNAMLDVVGGAPSGSQGVVTFARGMRVGGRRLVIGTTPSSVYGETPTGVWELSLVRVGAKADMDAMAQRMRVNGGRTDEEADALRESVRAANVKASQPYSSLFARVQNAKPDMTVFGIVLGGQWAGVQDVNDCQKPGWALGSAVPFCTPAADAPKPATRGTTCVTISNGSNFDTSWVGTQIGVPESDGSLVSSFAAGFIALAAISDRCRITVGVLASGEVGFVAIPTSRRGDAVRTIVKQLTAKYGPQYRSRTESWTNGQKTGVLTWSLPGLEVVYTEQEENNSGTAFDGGSIVITTSAWTNAIQAEKAASAKRPL